MSSRALLPWSLVLAVVAAGCPRTEAPKQTAPAHSAFYASTYKKTPPVAAMTELGRALFSSPWLSPTGRSCASCHDCRAAYGPANDQAVQLAGLDGKAAGVRAVPSLRYLQNVPPFNEHYQDSDGDGADQGPAGGYTWDGRAQTVHDQARLPLFSPLEMANASAADLIERLRRSPHAGQFRDVFGADALDSTEAGLKATLLSLEVFQQSPADFYPYSSRYDSYLQRRAGLTAQELRGLAIFNDPARGNCASCHPSGIKEGAFPALTDFGYVALGAPRNRAIPVNSNPGYFDLGLCGPLRTDRAGHADECGRFRTPSLRNVTLRRRFFHNGVFKQLKDVLSFYARRDTNPELWYPRGGDGSVRTFDDLPEQYRGNIHRDPPFGGRRGGRPSLSNQEIEDVLAFLGTLTDADQIPRLQARRQ